MFQGLESFQNVSKQTSELKFLIFFFGLHLFFVCISFLLYFFLCQAKGLEFAGVPY